jgi:ornithine cyclodeaminase/alanine dehydrogenase-like protein (mu-crystallin family)
VEGSPLTTDHIHAELGEIVMEKMPGHSDTTQVTLFKLVGIAIQDAMSARLAVENAQKMGNTQMVQ